MPALGTSLIQFGPSLQASLMVKVATASIYIVAIKIGVVADGALVLL